MKRVLTGDNEKIHPMMETIEFFVQKDKVYTTTELKEAEMLGSVKSILKTGYVGCEVVKTRMEIPEQIRKENENLTHNEVVTLYFLTKEGREYYNQNKPKKLE